MAPAYLTLLAAAVLAFLAGILIHRYAALCTWAGGGASVAYFFMEPVYSFHVADIADLVALGAYSAFGILLTFVPHRNRSTSSSGKAELTTPPLASFADNRNFGVRAGLEQAIETHGPSLRHSGIAIEAFGLPDIPIGTRDEVVKIFSDLISKTLAVAGAQHVSVNFGLTPDKLRVYWIVRTRNLPLRYLIRIGSADAVSEPATFPQWPEAVESTALRNPFQVIHQISFRR